MHWHSIRKAIRTHCLMPALRDRVDFHITHSRYSSGACSSMGAGGRVVVDGRKVLQCSADPSAGHDCRPAGLGSALAGYLYADPVVALASDNVMVAAMALLDRRLDDTLFRSIERDRFGHPMWRHRGRV